MTDPHCRYVASAAAIHRLPLPDAADVKEKFDLGATAQAAQLVVRGSRSAEIRRPGCWWCSTGEEPIGMRHAAAPGGTFAGVRLALDDAGYRFGGERSVSRYGAATLPTLAHERERGATLLHPPGEAGVS